MKSPRSAFISSGVLLALLSIVQWLYKPGLTAAFGFDDSPNLHNLTNVNFGDPQTVLSFIFGGAQFGGLGRPIAFASFLLHVPHWPSDPSAFLYINILIHLINGSLVAWFGIRLSRLVPALIRFGHAFAVSLAGVWMLQPLLASASLMIVQRMTTLAATFMLAGLITYLLGRERLISHQRWAWPIMLGGIGFGTLCAVFTKENGALLPLYAWVMEMTLLRSAREDRRVTVWRFVLAVPALIFLIYVVFNWANLSLATRARNFTLPERLLTEPRILWIYLQQLFLPVRAEFGPFHDDFPVSHGWLDPPSTLFAILAWLAAAIIAVTARRHRPWALFALGWFLIGHLLESTVFNLELYFEHRNYMPSLGPLAALCALVWKAPDPMRKTVLTLFGLYLFLIAFVLHELTSVWGNSRLAAELWAAQHPRSERAHQYLSQQYAAVHDYERAFHIISDGFHRNRMSTGLALQSLQLACALKGDSTEILKESMEVLDKGEVSYAIVDAISILSDGLSNKPCTGVTREVLHAIIDKLLLNPKFQNNPMARFYLHNEKAHLYFQTRDLDQTIHQLELSIDAKLDLDIATLTIGFLDSAGLVDAALSKVGEFRQTLPLNPLARWQWVKRLDELEGVLKAHKNIESIRLP